MIVRGTLMYLILFGLLRFILKRRPGARHHRCACGGPHRGRGAERHGQRVQVRPGRVVLVATIIFWNFALDWLGYRVAWIQRIVRPPPLLLIEDGRLLRRNMRQELITTDELMSQLRENGVASPAEVKRAHMEGDGTISVIRNEQG
jgi:hypothetical protein